MKAVETFLRVRLGFRVVVAISWILIIAIIWLWPRAESRAIPMAVFWWFRAMAILGAFYVAYEVSQLSSKRVGVRGVILDAAIVLSMFLFWFAVAAATF